MPPCRWSPHRCGVHSPGVLNVKDRFSSKPDCDGGGERVSPQAFSGLMVCTTPATAKIIWGVSRHRVGWAFPWHPGSSRGGGMERERGKLAQGLLGEVGTAPPRRGVAGAGGWPRHSTAHLASSSSSLPRRVAQLCRVASVAGEDALLVILFLSAFSHLPPPLGSASRRWVDRRLSGAAASPTASPACLTKPAQGMLPFWAECFLLQAQFRGKSLVFRDASEHPLSSSPQREQGGSWRGRTERQHSLLPPFQSPRQRFPLQQREAMREFQCVAARASTDLTQVLPLVPSGIQQPHLTAGEPPRCLQVRLSPCWGVWLTEMTPKLPVCHC